MHVPSSGEALDNLMENAYRRLIGVLGNPPVRGYEPMHGDLTPWNVRGLGDGRTAVFDWESAGWGPPGADHAYFWASAAAVGLSRQPLSASPEVVAFWTDRLAARNTGSQREARLAARLLDAMSDG
jgi:Ser/Thr protein kinase RdoA (MazF antagonist)